jgi:bacteriocin biosynthesis cyclodehydratase domain-containing protein
VIGVIQANEALKILVGYGEPLVGRLLMFDAQSTTFRELKLRRDPDCPTCGARRGAAPLPAVGACSTNGTNGNGASASNASAATETTVPEKAEETAGAARA